ncbi:hypothetical protein HJB79_14145 [Rhizobium lentis]|uniref:hypothetical protein n=1 Tax=Rhizobium TaxID=379 RepID=UPI0015965919|nr:MULTISPECIES: hypothetical protein [Rhizobium]MBB3356182.1 hypothetical protein [Rhizobium sp. BK049]MBX5133878.1 hypothetical protein [Rhizobium lentis]MBX5139901.1 hypothetical protein [Rhizobium lentis]MBX5152240.1 hypothetical protein [Rhizobium lentis]MBX5177994.1 hypothetical protein [Rhizobium lentis]
MDADIDMDFPVGKANWHCDRVEIHCCTHPVEMVDGGEFRGGRRWVQGKVAILHSFKQT